MKIQAINNNSFKGLFIDRAKEKNVDWHMEYRPYSWELDKETQKPKMALKEHVDVMKDNLPDNEEIYKPADGYYPASSRDILGTQSYYRYPDDVFNGKMRSTITVAEPLNREKSLEVYLEKMHEFKEKKELAQERLSRVSDNKIEQNYSDFVKYYSQYDGKLFNRSYEKEQMVSATRGLYENAKNQIKMAMDYIKLTESIKQSDKTMANIKAELETIEKAKKEGNVIDISVRDGNNPNIELENYMADKNYNDALTSSALIIFPATVMLLKDFVSKFAFNCPQLWHDKKGFAERVIKEANAYIKYMIK